MEVQKSCGQTLREQLAIVTAGLRQSASLVFSSNQKYRRPQRFRQIICDRIIRGSPFSRVRPLQDFDLAGTPRFLPPLLLRRCGNAVCPSHVESHACFLPNNRQQEIFLENRKISILRHPCQISSSTTVDLRCEMA